MKPIGDRYLEAESAFKRKHKKDKKLIAEVDNLLNLATVWYAVVMCNVYLELELRHKVKEQK